MYSARVATETPLGLTKLDAKSVLAFNALAIAAASGSQLKQLSTKVKVECPS
jgi:hypothetical protein